MTTRPTKCGWYICKKHDGSEAGVWWADHGGYWERASTYSTHESCPIEDLVAGTRMVTVDTAVAMARQMAERAFVSGWKWRSREDPSVCDPSLEAMVAKCGDEAAHEAEARL